MYTVYVLKNASKAFRYIGMTENLDRRMREHLKGYSKTTSRFLPVVLIHTEVYSTRVAARNREKYLKSGTGREFLSSLEK